MQKAEDLIREREAEILKQHLASLTPEEIQAYIEIATETLVEILSQRGMTVEQFHERRKQLIAEERLAIEDEYAKLNDPNRN